MPLDAKCAALRTGLALTLAIGMVPTAPFALVAEAEETPAQGTTVQTPPLPESEIVVEGETSAQPASAAAVQNSNGKVATLNGVEYATLAEAVEKAKDGDTIALSNNTTVTNPLEIEKSITIDLSKHVITLRQGENTNACGIHVANGDVVLKNGTVVDSRCVGTKGSGYIAIRVSGVDASLTTQDLTIESYAPNSTTNYNYSLRADGGASLTLDKGTSVIERAEGFEPSFGENTYGTVGVAVLGVSPTQDTEYSEGTATKLTVNDGASVVASSFAVSGNGSGCNNTLIAINGGELTSKCAQAIYHPQYGNLEVNGGEISGVTGIEMRAGNLTVGGSAKVAGGKGEFDFTPNGNGSTASNAAIVVSQHTTHLPISVSIYGGEMSGTMAFAEVNSANSTEADLAKIDLAIAGGRFAGNIRADDFDDGDEGFIYSGTFEEYGEEFPATLLAAGYELTSNSDGTSTPTATEAVASSNGVGYPSVALAIEYSNGSDVSLLANVKEDVVIPAGKTVTLDLNGFTLTNVSGHTITNNGTLTIVDSSENGAGTVDCVTHQRGALVNYGTVTVKGGTFTRSAEASTSPTQSGNNSWYVVDNQGAMTFDGGKVVNKSKFSSLVRNLKGTLTINDGEFENDFIALKNDEGGTLNVYGGTVTSSEQSLQNWSEATLSGGTFTGRVATWGQTAGSGNITTTAVGNTTITGTAVVNGDVQAINYMKSETSPVVTVSGGTVNGSVMKATHMGSGTNPANPAVGTSQITVTGGTFEANDNNNEALPFFMDKGVVAKSEDGSYVAMERGNLEAGTYLIPDEADGLSQGDFAQGVVITENADGTFTASRPYVPPANPSYDATVSQPENGTVELSDESAKAGDTVTIAATPDLGYEVGSVSVVSGGVAVEVTENADGTYGFTMPKGDVEVSVTFVDAWENPFSDVEASDWFYSSVRQANLLGLMHGIGGTSLFAPDEGLAREQAATVMWNALGEGNLEAPAAPQADVDQSQWYAPYVNWAVAAGAMDGYSPDGFGVGDALTREQFAAAVAKAVGADVGTADASALEGFADEEGVDGWAAQAMAWAVENGVVNGVEQDDGSRELQAAREITRAEMAAMVVNAVEVGVLEL